MKFEYSVFKLLIVIKQFKIIESIRILYNKSYYQKFIMSTFEKLT